MAPRRPSRRRTVALPAGALAAALVVALAGPAAGPRHPDPAGTSAPTTALATVAEPAPAPPTTAPAPPTTAAPTTAAPTTAAPTTAAPTTAAPTTAAPTTAEPIDEVAALQVAGVEAVAATAVAGEGVVEAWAEAPADPASPGPPAWQLSVRNEFDGPLHLMVLDQVGPWLRVQLPVRPNGTEGWIRRGDVALSTVRHRVEVGLSERVLRVWQGHEVVLEATVAVGRSSDPTPIGRYYLRDSFAWRPGSVYGPYVLPLSAFSESIEVINGGEAVVAIHGTNRPDLLGQAVSLGCIRMDDDAITALAHLIHPGTPVTISA